MNERFLGEQVFIKLCRETFEKADTTVTKLSFFWTRTFSSFLSSKHLLILKSCQTSVVIYIPAVERTLVMAGEFTNLIPQLRLCCFRLFIRSPASPRWIHRKFLVILGNAPVWRHLGIQHDYPRRPTAWRGDS